MFYIGDSDPDGDLSYRRPSKSPTTTARRRRVKEQSDEKYFTDTPGKCPTHARQKTEEINKTVTARSSNRKMRTSRQLRTPVTTDKKPGESDASLRTSKRSVKSPARKPRTNDKKVKVDRLGKNYRHSPSTDHTKSLSPDRRKKTAWRPHEKNDCSDSVDSISDTDSKEESPVKVRLSKHILKPPKFDGVRSFESFWAQFRKCVEHNG